MISLGQATDLIAQHEGFRATAYKDTRGILTIGYGTNLQAVGAVQQVQAAGLDYHGLCNGNPITQQQGQLLLAKAVRMAMDCATVRVRDFRTMPDNVQLAIVDMAYNLGCSGFCEFHQTIAALEAGDWMGAAEQMARSAWARQVGTRATDDIALVESALEAA